MSIQSLIRIGTYNNQVIELLQIEKEYRIDSRFLAPGIGIEHQTLLETLQKYQPQLEHFGLIRFETDAVKTESSRGVKYTKYALLNRNQALFAITLSRNTEQVVEWKMALIDALDQLAEQVKQGAAPALDNPKTKTPLPFRARKLGPAESLEQHIRRTMARLNRPVTVAKLQGSYIKTYDREIIRVTLESLVKAGVIQMRMTPHALDGVYELAQ